MRYFVESYGCTMNFGEGEQIASKMSILGHFPADSVEDADIIVLNTCTVIDTTEKRMIERINELKRMNKEIIVTGCMAKVQSSRISVRLPGSLIIPPDSYDSFDSSIEQRYGHGEASGKNGGGTNNDVRVTAIIPIASGCLGDCTYCITKFARGRLVSCDKEKIREQFIDAVERGCKEILITAQDAACYGFDTGTSLPSLIKELLSVNGEYRIRIGMMNPENLERIVDDLLDVMKDERIYKFIHVPVQSGSDTILKAMGRRYTVKQFIDIIERIRSRLPDISVSTDLIAGFPGESDEDHKKSLDLIQKISPDTVNVTRFSPRPGTEAASMEQMHGRVSKGRSRDITTTRFNEANERNKELIGTRMRVLVTENGKNGTKIARSENYRPVIVSGDNELGTFVNVVIDDCEPTHLYGSVV
jgi:MiaB-like tRNA modifying enzyme